MFDDGSNRSSGKRLISPKRQFAYQPPIRDSLDYGQALELSFRRGLFSMLAVINTPHEDKPVALRELAQLNRLPHGWRPGQDVAGTVVRQASDGSGPPAGARIVGLTEEAGWAERAPVPGDWAMA